MERSVFPTPAFQEALKPFARLHVNSQGSETEQAAYAKYAGEFLPTYVVLEADGTPVASTGWQGGTDASETLLAWLKTHAR